MVLIVIAFFIVLMITSGILIVDPSKIFDFIKKNSDSLGFQVFAVAIRLVMGGALLIVTAESRFPALVFFVGMLAIAAALFMAVIGRANFKQLIARQTEMKETTARVGGVATILFSGFIVYSLI